jgi:hypothetical protein
MSKNCSTCKSEKELFEFTKDKNKKDGLNINCRSCCKIIYTEYRNKNKEKESERGKKYNKEKRKIDKDKVKEYKKNYFQKNKESITQKRREKYKLNKEEINELRRNNAPKRLCERIGSSIRCILKKNGYVKISRTHEIIGCTPLELKIHIESKFEDWMNWNNYGLYNGELNYGWEIDHIVPLSSAKSEEDILKLNHYSNLQPLCSYTNRYIKSDKLDFKKG